MIKKSIPFLAPLLCYPGSSSLAAGLDADQISAVIHGARPAFLKCWDSAKQAGGGSDPLGTMELRISVLPEGKVGTAAVQNSSFKNTLFESCVSEALKTVSFPTADGETQVAFPLRFGPEPGTPKTKKKKK